MSFAIVSNSARSASRCVGLTGRTTSSRTRRSSQAPSSCSVHAYTSTRSLSTAPQWDGQNVGDGAFRSAVLGVAAVSATLGYFAYTSKSLQQEHHQMIQSNHDQRQKQSGTFKQSSSAEIEKNTGAPVIVATASMLSMHPSMCMSMFDESWSGMYMALGNEEDMQEPRVPFKAQAPYKTKSSGVNDSGTGPTTSVSQLQYNSSPGNMTAATTSAPTSLSGGMLGMVEASVKTAQTWEQKAKDTVGKLTKSNRFETSVRALKGGRLYMEDTYCIHDGGRFTGVFDGHGGSGVSKFISESVYSKMKRHLAMGNDGGMIIGPPTFPSLASVVGSMNAAFEELEQEVLQRDELQWQGSTAVAVYIHEDSSTNDRNLVAANIGDSRAILGKGSVAIDLTRDHKPDDVREKKRITDMGETVEWDEYCQVSRVKNLSLSRAVGDRFAKPVVSGEVEIQVFPLSNEAIEGDDYVAVEDDFIVLASDGLWDVMSSQNCVDFVHERLNPPLSQAKNMSPTEMRHYKISRRKNMSRYVVNEATRRGSCDNICVIVVWLNEINRGSGTINE